MRREIGVFPDAVGPTSTGTRASGSGLTDSRRRRGALLPTLLSDKGHKLEARHDARFVPVHRTPYDVEILDIEITDGYDEPPAVCELVEEGLGNIGGSGCDEYPVEGGKFLPTDRAVAAG